MIPDVKKSIPYTVCKKALLHQPFFLQACEDSIPDNDMVQQVKIHKGTGSGYLLCQLNIRYGRVRKSAGMIMYKNDSPGLKANGPPHDFLDIRGRRVQRWETYYFTFLPVARSALSADGSLHPSHLTAGLFLPVCASAHR